MVVESPTDIICPGLTSVRPPGILICFPINQPECVHKTHLIIKTVEPPPFHGQETRILLVGTPIFKIDFLMTNIPVGADDKFTPLPAQFFHVLHEIIHETEFSRQPFFAAGARRQIQGGDA